MKLEDQVCSLEHAKRLKELGAKQESLWFWCGYEEKVPEIVLNTDYREGVLKESFSAFTVAELGTTLPVTRWGCSSTVSGRALIWYRNAEGNGIDFDELKEADARAKMLIYLIENNLLRR